MARHRDAVTTDPSSFGWNRHTILRDSSRKSSFAFQTFQRFFFRAFFVWRFLSQKPRFGEIHQNFLEPFLAWQLRRYLFISLSTTAGVAICFGTSVAFLMALLHLLGKKPWYRGCCFDLDILREMATSCGTFSLCF